MVDSYRKLSVWNQSILLVKQVYQITESYPKKEQFRLVDQMCRSVTSIPANIAEGSARKSTKDFMRFVAIALGSIAELRTHGIVSYELGYIAKDVLQILEGECDSLGRQLQSLYNALGRKVEHA